MLKPLDLIRKYAWHLTVLSAALASGLLVYNRGVAVADDGNMVMAALRVLEGQVPFRDFVHFFYSPGSVYLLAALYAVFGDSYLLLRVLWMVMQAFCVLLVFVVASRFVSRRWALLPTAVVWLMPGPWFKVSYPFCALLAFWGMLRYLEQPGPRRSAELGALCALTLLLRQDIGMWALALSPALIGAARLAQRGARSWPGFGTDLAWFAGLTAGLLLPVLAYFHAKDALLSMLSELFVVVPALTSSRWIRTALTLRDGWSQDPVLLVIYVFHYVSPLVGALLLRSKGSSTHRLPIAALLVFNLCVLSPALVSVSLIRIMQASYLNWIVFTALLSQTTNLATRRPRSTVAIALLVLMLLLPLLYVANTYVTRGERSLAPTFTGTFAALLLNGKPLDIRGERIYVSEATFNLVTTTKQYLEANTTREDSVLFLPANSLFNYWFERDNPTKFIGLWTHLYGHPFLKHRIGLFFVSQLEEHEIPFVLYIDTIPQLNLGPAVNRYLQRHYVPLANTPFPVYLRRQQLDM
jgi:hypothetical protein